MATQPNVLNQASIPPPQTNIMIMQQSGLMSTTVGDLPGERPDKDIEMARAQLLGVANVSTDTTIGSQIQFTMNGLNYASTAYPVLPVRESTLSLQRFQAAYSSQFYFHQHSYWNSEVVLHFWAVKPPQAIMRIRFIYTPPGFTIPAPDSGNREITKVWDLSASNLFEFKIPSFNMRQYRNCAGNYAALNGSTKTYSSPAADFKVGYVRAFVTHLYQPGSIFPANFNIYMFQSFQNSQFAVYQGPAIPVERTCLTRTINLT